jgi:hypothetical protein
MNPTTEFTKASAAELAQKILAATDAQDWLPAIEHQWDHVEEKWDAAFSRLPWPEGGDEGRIGIWKPQEMNGEPCYVRDVRLSGHWRLWANRHVITPKQKGQQRVILLGESVARGYFYDPYYNPAMVLEGILQQAMGKDAVEVLDLAKNGLNIEELDDIGQSCLQLEPDAIIVFAGNNWCKHLVRTDIFSPEDLQMMAEAMEACDFSVLKKIMEAKMRERINSCVHKMAGLAAAKNIRLIFIIPEFNLRDWKSSPLEKIIARLPGDNTAAWLAAKNAAEEALQLGQTDTAIRYATQMIHLDASNPLGYEWLADCRLREGAYDEGRRLLEEARDAAMFCRVQYTPRCFAINGAVLKEAALTYGFSIVDLPAIFRTALNGDVPGKDLFLDYCHLTVRGIRIAMEATARTLLDISGYGHVQLPADILREPDSEVMSMAEAFAAVHNSRYGQGRELLRHYCMEAVRHGMSAGKFMLQFTSLTTRKIPNILCKNYEYIITGKMGDQYGNGTGLLHPDKLKLLELELMEGMIAALQSTGVDISQQLYQLRIREHGTNNRKVNLLESYYRLFSNHAVLGADFGHYTAHDVRSDFMLVTAGNRHLQLTLTFRTPPGSNHKDICLEVNGKQVASFESSHQWKTQHITLSPAELKEDVNDIRICWPLPERWTATRQQQEAFAYRSLENMYNSLYPALGEIHMFTAMETE